VLDRQTPERAALRQGLGPMGDQALQHRRSRGCMQPLGAVIVGLLPPDREAPIGSQPTVITPGGRKQGPLSSGIPGIWMATAVKPAEAVIHSKQPPIGFHRLLADGVSMHVAHRFPLRRRGRPEIRSQP
jgi:hypothetical protein